MVHKNPIEGPPCGVRSNMISHYTWGSVTTLFDFRGFLASHNFMVMALGLCVKWPLLPRPSHIALPLELEGLRDQGNLNGWTNLCGVLYDMKWIMFHARPTSLNPPRLSFFLLILLSFISREYTRWELANGMTYNLVSNSFLQDDYYIWSRSNIVSIQTPYYSYM